MADDLAIQGVNLCRSYGNGVARTTAVRDVSLELRRGQITLLMGPSGSGKSTLLAILSGLLRPDSGRVHALGEDLWNLSERGREQFRLRHCGFIFQGYNLFPALTARQQLEMVLRWGEGVSHREAARRVDEMLEILGLSNKGHLHPSDLSGGEKQRVAIGRALIKRPGLCFADEPTSALSWIHGEQVVSLLKAAAYERDASILIVSHDPRIEAYADQTIRIADGTLMQEPRPVSRDEFVNVGTDEQLTLGLA